MPCSGSHDYQKQHLQTLLEGCCIYVEDKRMALGNVLRGRDVRASVCVLCFCVIPPLKVLSVLSDRDSFRIYIKENSLYDSNNTRTQS